ncbi:MAG TPA: DUF4197 domain-containing protein [Desulfurivibrionaceae bacterium]|nr:DUF4197 domain-containing protein [Desulfurivibrionaceae bacterium]
MKPILDRILEARWAIAPAAVVFGLALLLAAGQAQADWLQLGKELLTTLNQNQNQNQNLIQAGKPNLNEISNGLKEALKVGTERVVGQLGRTDGFNNDPAIHIPLPEKLEAVKSVLGRIGLAYMLDDLELRLNRAAETATPQAKAIFWQAITEMTMEDAMAIYQGPEDSATRYFAKRMTAPLTESMRPVIEESLAQAGAVQAFDAVMGKYRALPLVRNVKTDLTGHVVERGVSAIFLYLAKEEAAIRRDPVKRTTELLRRVFGSR